MFFTGVLLYYCDTLVPGSRLIRQILTLRLCFLQEAKPKHKYNRQGHSDNSSKALGGSLPAASIVDPIALIVFLFKIIAI